VLQVMQQVRPAWHTKKKKGGPHLWSERCPFCPVQAKMGDEVQVADLPAARAKAANVLTDPLETLPGRNRPGPILLPARTMCGTREQAWVKERVPRLCSAQPRLRRPRPTS